MTSLCDTLLENMLAHLRAEHHIQQESERACYLVTPFTYPDLAPIELTLENIGSRYRITDDGETLHILFLHGLTLSKSIYREIQAIAAAHQIIFQNDTLYVEADETEIASAYLRLINAIQAVAHLLYKRRHKPSTAFHDTVEEFLIANQIVYQPNYRIAGKSTLHTLRLFVNSDRNIGIEPITARTIASARKKAQQIAFKFFDIRNASPETAPRFIAVLDDRGQRAKIWQDRESLAPLETYADALVKWSTEDERRQLLDALTKKP